MPKPERTGVYARLTAEEIERIDRIAERAVVPTKRASVVAECIRRGLDAIDPLTKRSRRRIDRRS